MFTQAKHENYHAYLIRFWRDGENKPWRVTLEDPHSGLKYGFANLEKLFNFLNAQANYEHPAPEPLT